MIINLDLAKTYGQQNADIAKKNKINQIDMTINLYPESGDSSEDGSESVSYGPIAIDDNYANLSEIKIVESKTNNNLDLDLKGFPLEYVEDTSDYFPTYYGIIKYKNYNISIDLTNPNYENLKYIDTIIPFVSSFNGNRKYSNSGDRITFISNSSGSYSSISSSEIENGWSIVDIVNIFDNLSSSNDFYGITVWDEDYNFNDNEFTVTTQGEEHTTNILDELSDIIQNGANNVSSNFLNLNNYLQPKINTWNNDNSELEINISIPTSVYIFNSEKGCRYVHQGVTTGFQWVNRVYYDELNIYKYNFTELNLSFAVNYTSETEQVTYHNGNYPYTTENSMLFTEGVVNADTHRITVTTTDSSGVETLDGYVYDTFYSEDFADNLFDRYQNGKMQLSITYPIGHLQTINGLDVVYSEEYGLCTNIGNEYFDINGNKLSIGDDDTITNVSQIPEGTLCYITKNGEVYYKNADGSPKLFIVQTSNLVCQGILVNELTLIESSEQFVSAFNESSWAEIDAMGKIGVLQDHLSVGEQKTISLASGQDITLSILDFNHDDLADGSGKAGMTIGMESRLANVYQMNSTASTNLSWSDCTFRTQTIPQLITDLPSDLQSIIQPVIKYSATSNNNLSTVSASEDKLFLQSLTEITGPAYIQDTTSLSSIFSSIEGEQYEYWKTIKDGTVAEDRKKSNENWTTRSVSSDTVSSISGETTATFGVINDSGNIINIRPNTPETVFNNHGISYAFCVGKQPFSFSGTLQDATWQQINYISTNGLAQQYFAVGDEKTITLSTGEEITLVILGFNHDNMTDGSGKAGITFGMKELLQDTYQMSNAGISSTRWDSCTMYVQTLPIIFSQLPNDLQLIIKEVYKRTNEKLNIDSEEVSTVNSPNKLWLFSEVEIDGTQKDYYVNEGNQYEYWKTVKDGTVAEDRVKYINSSPTQWWLRSRGEGGSTTVFLYIDIDGTIISGYNGLQGNYHGVSFGFCV